MSIILKEYNKDSFDSWNNFLKNSKNGIFMFNRNFMEYHSDRFKDNSLLFYDDEELLALLPASIQDNILYSHGGLTYGGFITNEKMKQHKMLECMDCLIKYMKEHSIEKIIYKTVPHIYHKQPAEEDIYALFINNAQMLKTEASTTVLLKDPCKMPKGRKAQVSRAKREGITISQSSDFKMFIELENSVLSEYHGVTAVHNAKELELLNSRFEKEIQLWCAYYKEKMIAGTLLFVYDDIVHTQYMAANEVARELGGLDYLIKTLMDKFSSDKTYFDFGISTENCGRYLNEGLIRQKEGFGGRTTVYNTYELKI